MQITFPGYLKSLVLPAGHFIFPALKMIFALSDVKCRNLHPHNAFSKGYGVPLFIVPDA
jgi:hypothetical protein